MSQIFGGSATNVWVGYMVSLCMGDGINMENLSHFVLPAGDFPCEFPWLAITHVELTSWGFPTHSFPFAEMHIGFLAKSPLFLFSLNQDWNMSTDFSKLPQYHTS
jgi:hypothetical protein